jgi:ABC-type transporter MlaC component
MRKNLTRLLLIFVLITVSGCVTTQPKPVVTTITITQQEFYTLKDNVVKLGQDAKYYHEKYNDCIKSKQ